MNVLNRYIARNVLAAIFMVLVSLQGLGVIFKFFSELEHVQGDYSFIKALQFVLLEQPMHLYTLMPLAAMVGCLVGLGALANSSELVVMRAAGVSTLRLVWMAIKPASLVLVAAMLIGEYVAPKAQNLAENIKAIALSKQSRLDVNRVVWLRDGDDFIFADVIQPGGVIYGLNVFVFNNDDRLLKIRQAKRATFQQDHWLMENVMTTHFTYIDGEVNSAENKEEDFSRWDSALSPELTNMATSEPKHLQMQKLWRYKQYLDQQNLNSIEYELAFWEKAFYPLVMISLVLVGVAFVFGPLREVTMGYRIFSGVMLGVVFNTIQQAVGPVSIVFGLPPLLSMMVPPLLSTLLGLVMLLRVR